MHSDVSAARQMRPEILSALRCQRRQADVLPEVGLSRKKFPIRTLEVILALIPYSPSLRFTKSHFGISRATVLMPTKDPNHVVTSIMGDEAARPR